MKAPTAKSIAGEKLMEWRKVRRHRAVARLIRQAFLFNWFKGQKGAPFKNHEKIWTRGHKIAGAEIRRLNP